jgi:hypothetical protein
MPFFLYFFFFFFFFILILLIFFLGFRLEIKANVYLKLIFTFINSIYLLICYFSILLFSLNAYFTSSIPPLLCYISFQLNFFSSNFSNHSILFYNLYFIITLLFIFILNFYSFFLYFKIVHCVFTTLFNFK